MAKAKPQESKEEFPEWAKKEYYRSFLEVIRPFSLGDLQSKMDDFREIYTNPKFEAAITFAMKMIDDRWTKAADPDQFRKYQGMRFGLDLLLHVPYYLASRISQESKKKSADKEEEAILEPQSNAVGIGLEYFKNRG